MRTYLVDCPNLCWKAAHAFPKGLSHENQDTAVVFGFLVQVLTAMDRFGPGSVVFAWDSRESLRRELFPGYKDRPKKNPELYESVNRQMVLLRRKVLPGLGFRNIFQYTGYEADDIIAEIVSNNTLHAWVVLSGDEDLWQLAGWCRIWNGKEEITCMTVQDLVNNVGSWPLMKAIAGCSSDTIPGVEGVGEKTAMAYLRERDTVSERVAEKIRNAEEIISRNLKLVELPYPGCPASKLAADDVTMLKVQMVCMEYGMHSLVSPTYVDRWNLVLNEA